ncbi:MAG: hypothetical protein WEE50_11420 [Chloroflexota bacterium]
MRTAGTLSIAGPWLVAVGLFVALIATGAVAASSDPLIDLPTLTFLVVVGLWGLVQASVGALIAWRRPENRIGRLLQASGALVLSVFVGFIAAAARTTAIGPGDPVGGIAGWWASTTIFFAIYLAFPLVGILYPDGRLPSPRWRFPVGIVTTALLAVSPVYAVAIGPLGTDLPDNPFGLIAVSTEVRELAGLVGTLALIVAMALAVVAIAVRWHRGSHVERSQLKWLFAALVVAGMLFPLTGSAVEAPSVLTNLSVGSALLIPVAIGIAILRYRLYEIDRLISRTIGWAVVTGVLVTVFAGAVVALQGVLDGVTQGQTLAVAASTLVAFALFQPVRRRVQSLVDRRFDRARYDAQRTVDAFAEHLRNEVDLATLRTALVATADDAIRPVSTTVWLRTGAEAAR